MFRRPDFKLVVLGMAMLAPSAFGQARDALTAAVLQQNGVRAESVNVTNMNVEGLSATIIENRRRTVEGILNGSIRVAPIARGSNDGAAPTSNQQEIDAAAARRFGASGQNVGLGGANQGRRWFPVQNNGNTIVACAHGQLRFQSVSEDQVPSSMRVNAPQTATYYMQICAGQQLRDVDQQAMTQASQVDPRSLERMSVTHVVTRYFSIVDPANWAGCSTSQGLEAIYRRAFPSDDDNRAITVQNRQNWRERALAACASQQMIQAALNNSSAVVSPLTDSIRNLITVELGAGRVNFADPRDISASPSQEEDCSPNNLFRSSDCDRRRASPVGGGVAGNGMRGQATPNPSFNPQAYNPQMPGAAPMGGGMRPGSNMPGSFRSVIGR